jgi:hypothetical protein
MAIAPSLDDTRLVQNGSLPKFWGTTKLMQASETVLISKMNHELAVCWNSAPGICFDSMIIP